MDVKSQAMSAPAAPSPPRHSTSAAGRQYAQLNSSSRVQRTETGFPRGAGQAGRLDGGLGRVLPAEAAAHVGHDHANAVARDPERLGEVLLRPKGPVAAGPDREAVPVPLGHGGARLHRGVLDEGDTVRLREDTLGLSQCRLERSLLVRACLAPLRLRAQVLEQVLVRDGLGRRLPDGRGRDGVERLRRTERGRRGEADERSLAQRDHVAHRPGRREVDRLERRSQGRRPQDASVEHPRATDVGGKEVGARDEVARVRARRRLAQGLPAGDRGQRDVGPDRLAEARRDVRGLRQVGVSHRPPGRARDHAALHVERRRFDLPLPCRERRQQLARGGRGLAHLEHVSRGRAAAGGHAVVGDEVGVGHDEAHARDRHAQLLGRGLGELASAGPGPPPPSRSAP